MGQFVIWRCHSCRAPLGTIRGGTLTPAVPVVRIEADGAAHVRCPSCSTERVWKPLSRRGGV